MMFHDRLNGLNSLNGPNGLNDLKQFFSEKIIDKIAGRDDADAFVAVICISDNKKRRFMRTEYAKSLVTGNEFLHKNLITQITIPAITPSKTFC